MTIGYSCACVCLRVCHNEKKEPNECQERQATQAILQVNSIVSPTQRKYKNGKRLVSEDHYHSYRRKREAMYQTCTYHNPPYVGCACMRTCVHVCVCERACEHVCVCERACEHVCARAHLCVHASARVCVCVCVCVCVHANVRAGTCVRVRSRLIAAT